MSVIKILHCADLHMDAPISGRTPEQSALLHRALLDTPGKITRMCEAHSCDLLLIAGDVFDRTPRADSVTALKAALERVGIPVFIAPGNHDFCAPDSPWLTTVWPENVHIFTKPVLESIILPELSCRIYGAGYQSMDCPPLLEDFHAKEDVRFHIGVLHGDPTSRSSPYCPVTTEQVRESGLDYLALGHIHKGGSFTAGDTLCAWPGCTMGRGYDEEGIKGVLLVTIDEHIHTEFLPLDNPRFYDLETEAGLDPQQAVSSLLPAAGNDDFYRITLTGPSPQVDLPALQTVLAQFPNLVLRDETVPLTDLWKALDEDTLEGAYFRKLHAALDGLDEQEQQCVLLAARISRQLLDGQEVKLP